jgi:hypothetical protein
MEYGIMFHAIRSLVTVIRNVPHKASRQTHISRDLKEKEAKRAGREAYLGIPRKRANPQIYGETGELDRWVDPISPVFVLYSPPVQ